MSALDLTTASCYCSGVRRQASGVRRQASGVRRQASGVRRQASSLTTLRVAVLTVAALAVTACDLLGIQPPEEPPPANRGPESKGTIPVVPLVVGGAAHTVDVAGYFTDPDGDLLTYRATTSNEKAATVRAAGSRVTITPVAAGTAEITVTATDPGALAATQRFQVTVSNRNRAPTAKGTIPELPLVVGGSPGTVDVAGYFRDPNGDTLSYAAESSKEEVATVRSAASTVTVTPLKPGRARITVTATDPGGLSVEQTFDVQVQAASQGGTAAQGQLPDVSLVMLSDPYAIPVQSYFSGPEGGALSYAAESSNEQVATVSTAGSTVTVTAKKTGSATITVTATGSDKVTAEQRFEVTVTNRAPSAQGTIAVAPLVVGGSPGTVDAAGYFTDPDGHALSYAAESSKEEVATVSAAGSTVTITPLKPGSARITVTATDPGGLSAEQTFDVQVQAASQGGTAAQGQLPDVSLVMLSDPYAIPVQSYFSGPEGGALSYAAESSNEQVAAVSTAGSTVTITAKKTGSATVTVTATGSDKVTAEQRFEVTVTNRAPSAQGTMSLSPLVVGGSPGTVDVAGYFTDPDGHALSYAAESSKEEVATVSAAGSTVTITPLKPGSARITVTATDPGRLEAEQQFQVTVSNRAPVATGTISAPPLVVGASPHAVDVSRYFRDPDGEALSYAAQSLNESVATVRTAGSTVTITAQKTGRARITVTATDPGGLSVEQTFDVQVQAASQGGTAAQGKLPDVSLVMLSDPYAIPVQSYFSGPEGEELSYAAESSNERVAAVSTAGSTVTITAKKTGSATVTVTATGSDKVTAEQRFEVTVTNRAPSAQGTIAVAPLVVGGSPGTVDVAGYFTDPDGHALSYAAESSNEQVATVRSAGSTVTITPLKPGSARITVTATDPGELTGTQRFEVTVRNRAPTKQGTISLSPLVVGGSPGTVDVALYFTDPDGDTLSYAAQSSDTKVATAGIGGSTLTVTAVAAGTATITVTASDPGELRATQGFPVTVQEPVQSPPVTDPSVPLELQSLTVTGGNGSPYPAFAAGVLHYAVRCGASTTLRVQAQSRRAGAGVTLLRADSTANQSATGSLDASVTVNGDHDVAIRLSDGGATKTYVVHCIPDDFPDVTILKKTASVTEGLLLMAAANDRGIVDYWTILDNNGVPRFHRKDTGRDFRRHPDGRYSVIKANNGVVLFDRLDQRLGNLTKVSVVAPLTNVNDHDFRIDSDGNYVFISYHATTRDLCEAPQEPCPREFRDSVIQKVTPGGQEVFRWNSWDHMKLSDCFPDREYAHLNSVQPLDDGDIIASFSKCSQVLRIDGTTGAVEWKLGGTTPTRDPSTVFLPITGDPAGEFCFQHQPTLTAAGTVVLFDNGAYCLGPRKNRTPFTRVVEYDVSSGRQAVFKREFRLPQSHGIIASAGGVTVLPNGRWLIAWGGIRLRVTAPLRELMAVSEVDPATDTALLHVNLAAGGRRAETYRVYREPEADVRIPLNLP